MLDLDELLREMIDRNASDLFIKTGSPPSLRVDGVINQCGYESLTVEDTQAIAKDMMNDAQWEAFNNNMELDLALGMRGVGRFRVNCYKQRGSIGMVLRHVSTASLNFEDLHIPLAVRNLSDEARGLTLVTGTTGSGKSTTLATMIQHINKSRQGHIVSIEDPLAEDDGAGLKAFGDAVGSAVQIIGDDYLVTNAARVRDAAQAGICNAVLVKPNQAGTLTETKAAFDAAQDAAWGAIVSARSGETEDVTIVHLATGWGATQLKVGSFARSERMAKWNEGLRIGETLSNGGALPPRTAFPWGQA